ncbi:MAG TPA: hypothetical protein VEX69_08395 [Candidatus Limnocylindria bacterium]|nr:hypothetical protein [Candidatus Limnocylindria bacterium]
MIGFDGQFEFCPNLLRRAARLCSLAVLFGLIPSAIFAGTLTGTIHNGTSGKPAVGVDVILIQLQGGMQPVASTKSDAQGRFQFDRPDIGAAPMLLRAVYRGVNYHEPVPPGKTTADVQVFEPTDKPGTIAVTNHAVIIQPNGAELLVGVEFTIENKSQPPVAYFRADGSFNFSIPDGAQFNQAAAWGSSGMPVVQGTMDKGKNQMAIAFPFRPGESGVRLSYRLPYPGNHLTLRNALPYASGRLIVAAPPSVQISGDGLAAAGQDQGFSVYVRESVAANAGVNIAVSGTAPMPAANSGNNAPTGGQVSGPPPNDAGQTPSVNSRLEASGAEALATTATSLPARLDSLKWILVGGFAAIFALGFVYLLRRPQVVAVGVSDGAPTAAPAAPATKSTPKTAESAVANLSREVRGSLDELKDNLFRLELRRQAGTISEQDYARERQRMEQVLRDLVRG